MVDGSWVWLCLVHYVFHLWTRASSCLQDTCEGTGRSLWDLICQSHLTVAEGKDQCLAWLRASGHAPPKLAVCLLVFCYQVPSARYEKMG